MWILFAAASALFAGLSAIFGKYGVQGADSDIATAVRTIIVLAFAWLVFGERLTLRSMAGLVCIVIGTLLLVLPLA